MKRTLLLMTAAAPAAAQVPLRGLAYDSLHGKPLSGAFIGIVGMTTSAMSDSVGRFVLPSVPKGTHRVVMQHDVLDAIGLSAAGARAVVNGENDSVVVAVPSFGTLWRAACGRNAPSVADSGFVFGTVQRGGQPVPRGVVTVSWLDLSVDSSKAVRQKQKIMEIDADSSGNYSACGVPTNTGLSMRANVGSTFGAWNDVPPLDNERIARRDLSLVAAAPVQFALPQASAVQIDSTSRGSQIKVVDSIPVTDSKYGPNDEAMRQFEENQRAGVGKFWDRAALMKAGDRRMSDLLGQLPGATMQTGSSGQGWILPKRVGATKSMSINAAGTQMGCDAPRQDSRVTGASCATACYPHAILDGVDVSPTEVPNVNRFTPDQLEGIEYYATSPQVPKKYSRLNKTSCGLLVLHTRRGKSP